MSDKEYVLAGKHIKVRNTISEGAIVLSYEVDGNLIDYQSRIEIAVIDEMERVHGLDAVQEVIDATINDIVREYE